jgi:hypothetical protein
MFTYTNKNLNLASAQCSLLI